MRQAAIVIEIAGALNQSFHAAFSSTDAKLRSVRSSLAALDKTGSELQAFQRVSLSLEKTKLALLKQTEGHSKLTEKIKVQGTATAIQEQKLRVLADTLGSTRQRLSQQTSALDGYRQSLGRAGYAVDHLAEAEKKLATASAKFHVDEKGLLAFHSAQQQSQGKREKYSEKVQDLKSFGLKALLAPAVLALPMGYAHELTKLYMLSRREEKNDPLSDNDLRSSLRATTLGIARDFPVSATTAARAGSDFAQAGFSANELKGILPVTTKVVLATDSSMEDVGSLMRKTRTNFKLDASSSVEMERLANTLAKTASMSEVGVKSIVESSKYLTDLPHTMGLNYQDTFSALSVMGDHGLPDSTAGTSFVAFLERISKPLIQGKIKKQFNVDITAMVDGKSVIRNPLAIVDDLARASRKMDPAKLLSALVEIFDTEAGRAIRNLINGSISGELSRYRKALDPEKIEKDYIDRMMNDMKASPINAGKLVLTNLQAASIEASTPIEPAGLSLLNSLAEGAKGLSSFIHEHQTLIKTLALGGTVLVGATFAFKAMSATLAGLSATSAAFSAISLATGFGGLKAVVTAAGAALGALSTAVLTVGALATAGYVLWKNWDTVGNILTEVSTKVKDFILAPSSREDLFWDGDDWIRRSSENTSVQRNGNLQEASYHDSRQFTFNVTMPQMSTESPRSFVEALKVEVKKRTFPMSELKPRPFFDQVEGAF